MAGTIGRCAEQEQVCLVGHGHWPPEDAAATTFYRAICCSKCSDTGYRGRIAIYEIMPITDAVRRHIVQRSPDPALREVALAAGMTSLGEDVSGAARRRGGNLLRSLPPLSWMPTGNCRKRADAGWHIH
jgi:type II secretory ATPase GspE/PulE/Tfp pilus assembly ATPase PilB-like protein